jgi:hypothetical protein
MGRVTCETCLWIDVRLWHQQGHLRSGSSFTMSWIAGDEPCGCVHVQITSSAAILSYRIQTADDVRTPPVQQEIPILGTRCNFGGARPWFHCVACNRRVAKLFLAAPDGFRCRHCYGLAFESQREPLRLRGLTMARKIRALLGGDANILDPLPPRKKGMHQRTYKRLARRYTIAAGRSGAG